MKYSSETLVNGLILSALTILIIFCNGRSLQSNNSNSKQSEYLVTGLSNNGVYQTLMDGTNNPNTSLVKGYGSLLTQYWL